MFNKQRDKLKGKLEDTISKAVSGNIDMRSLLALLHTIGVTLACIAGFLAIGVVILLSNVGGPK